MEPVPPAPSLPPAPDWLRLLPSVGRLIDALGGDHGLPRGMAAREIRDEVRIMREAAQHGTTPPGFPEALARVQQRIAVLGRTRIQPVINGTGVLLHTNLGRAPLSPAAGEAVRRAACAYNNLEFDPETGERGRRGRFAEAALAALTGAGSATVTNNCAAALVLILRHLTAGERNEVIISRGQLIEIGGGFRVPEIMETSGARLREVGTTNRVTLGDYQRAIGPRTALILRVHRSNFTMEGFVGEPGTAELSALAQHHERPLVEDLGSGAVSATEQLDPALGHEPMPQESLGQGADLVCFSGDKLFGGPQAGIIAGRTDLIAGILRDPLFRALRCDKLILAALEETALEYLHAMETGAAARLPLPGMIAAPLEELTARAAGLAAGLSGLPLHAAPGTGTSRCGGGTMPQSSLPSVTLDLRPSGRSLEQLALRLRQGSPPVIGYIAGDRLKVDLRTVFPHQDGALADAIRNAAV